MKDCFYYDDDFCVYYGELCKKHPECNGVDEAGGEPD